MANMALKRDSFLYLSIGWFAQPRVSVPGGRASFIRDVVFAFVRNIWSDVHNSVPRRVLSYRVKCAKNIPSKQFQRFLESDVDLKPLLTLIVQAKCRISNGNVEFY